MKDVIKKNGATLIVAGAGWDLDFVVLGGSHTHAGPHNHPTAWYSEMENKVIAAIGEAKTNLFPARIGAGMGPVESQYFDSSSHERRRTWCRPRQCPLSGRWLGRANDRRSGEINPGANRNAHRRPAPESEMNRHFSTHASMIPRGVCPSNRSVDGV